MNTDLLRRAAAIAARSDRRNPADAVLRAELKSSRLSAADARAVSRAMFAWFRWRGWPDTDAPSEAGVRETLRLAEQFAAEPKSFPESDLRQRAVPAWTGEAMEIPAGWLRAIQSEPRLWLRARRGQGRNLARRLGECWIPAVPALSDAIEYLGEADLFRAPEFHAGEFELQDIASQAVGLLCAPQPGETWWDACAGEGGKLLHLSDLMNNQGLIWASDRAEWRLKLLKRRAARARCFNYRAAHWDGGPKLPTRTKFDGVLVDAPCSGLGTWQRNPHARWTTTPEDVRELAAVQAKLLTHAAPAVKSGGKLIYAVCTLTRAETIGVVEQFSATQPELEPATLLSLKETIESSRIASATTLTLWPQDLGGNGMLVAAWRRR